MSHFTRVRSGGILKAHCAKRIGTERATGMAIEQSELTGIDVKDSLTDVRKANRLFLEQVRQLPGVLHVEPRGGDPLGEPSFRVVLREDDLAAEYSVYELQGRIYNLYPQ